MNFALNPPAPENLGTAYQPAPRPTNEPESRKGSGWGAFFISLFAVVAGFAIGYYFKTIREKFLPQKPAPKPDTSKTEHENRHTEPVEVQQPRQYEPVEDNFQENESVVQYSDDPLGQHLQFRDLSMQTIAEQVGSADSTANPPLPKNLYIAPEEEEGYK